MGQLNGWQASHSPSLQLILIWKSKSVAIRYHSHLQIFTSLIFTSHDLLSVTTNFYTSESVMASIYQTCIE